MHDQCHKSSPCQLPSYSPSKLKLTEPAAIEVFEKALKQTLIYRNVDSYCSVSKGLLYEIQHTCHFWHRIYQFMHHEETFLYSVVTHTGWSCSTTSSFPTVPSTSTLSPGLLIWEWILLSWTGWKLRTCMLYNYNGTKLFCLYIQNNNVARDSTSEQMVDDMRRPDHRTSRRALVEKTCHLVHCIWEAYIHEPELPATGVCPTYIYMYNN